MSADLRTRYATLGKGDFVGEIAILTGIRRTATIMTNTACKFFFVLTKLDFDIVLQDFPADRSVFRKVATDRVTEMKEKKRKKQHEVKPPPKRDIEERTEKLTARLSVTAANTSSLFRSPGGSSMKRKLVPSTSLDADSKDNDDNGADPKDNDEENKSPSSQDKGEGAKSGDEAASTPAHEIGNVDGRNAQDKFANIALLTHEEQKVQAILKAARRGSIGFEVLPELNAKEVDATAKEEDKKKRPAAKGSKKVEAPKESDMNEASMRLTEIMSTNFNSSTNFGSDAEEEPPPSSRRRLPKCQVPPYLPLIGRQGGECQS